MIIFCCIMWCNIILHNVLWYWIVRYHITYTITHKYTTIYTHTHTYNHTNTNTFIIMDILNSLMTWISSWRDVTISKDTLDFGFCPHGQKSCQYHNISFIWSSFFWFNLVLSYFILFDSQQYSFLLYLIRLFPISCSI